MRVVVAAIQEVRVVRREHGETELLGELEHATIERRLII